MNGCIIWKGPSQLDGESIVAIATGLKKTTGNEKTGNMVQTWILRSDVSPVDAVHSGADVSICGDCRHRGKPVDGVIAERSCYVKVWQAPRSVYNAFQKGTVYPTLPVADIRNLFSGRNIRLGSYGDPAAIPFDVWESVLPDAAAITGYTHAWRYCDSRFARYCMASADSALEKIEAELKGYRVFRVKPADSERLSGEVVCPASKEAGQKTNCALCRACGGLSAKAKAGIVINAHGSGMRHVT